MPPVDQNLNLLLAREKYLRDYCMIQGYLIDECSQPHISIFHDLDSGEYWNIPRSCVKKVLPWSDGQVVLFFTKCPGIARVRNPPRSSGPDIPNKEPRPRAYDTCEGGVTHRYQWRNRSIPEKICVCGKEENNPFLKRAIFVVHGIGDQEDGRTAAVLRSSLEDAVRRLEPQLWDNKSDNRWIVPAPFVLEGFWAKYHDLEWLVPDIYKALTDRPRRFFKQVWEIRTQSVLRPTGWLVRKALSLVFRPPNWLTWMYFLAAIVPICVLALGAQIHKTYRAKIRTYVNDAMLYLEPKGDVEHEIVQRIDYRVGEQFLELLGLDWNFDELTPGPRKYVGPDPEPFEEVVWVAHSLGTVISYNVISDLLHKCKEIRTSRPIDVDKLARVRKVEKGLFHFITLGSPLEKIAYLYGTFNKNTMKIETNSVLRLWPDDYGEGGAYKQFSPFFRCEVRNSGIDSEVRRKSDLTPKADEPSWPGNDNQNFWVNFYYASDPVSGELKSFGEFVDNVHIRGRFWLPGISHNRYWKHAPIIGRILELTFNNYTKHENLKLLSPVLQLVSSIGSAVLYLAILWGVLWGIWRAWENMPAFEFLRRLLPALNTGS